MCSEGGMQEKTVFLIKHGETEQNLRGIHQGQSVGGSISLQGRADIRRVGECFAASGLLIDKMIVSPMQRCRESAALLSALVPPVELCVDARLNAKDSGHFGGRPRQCANEEAERQGIPLHQFRAPGGESSEDVLVRYRKAWNAAKSDSSNTIIFIGHGGGIACLLLWLNRDGFHKYLEYVPTSAAVTMLRVNSRPKIQFMNAKPSQLCDLLEKHMSKRI